jgi:hypothetical protein
MSDIDDRHDRLESQLEKQQRTIEEQRELIEAQRDRLDALATGDETGAREDLPVSRRSALTAGGLLALLGLGAGTASASNPTGQVGTQNRPIRALFTEEVNGGLTGGAALTDLRGTGIGIDAETLAVEDGGIDTGQLASDAVGSGEIASGAVDTDELASGAVDTDELASGAVGTATIASGAVGSGKIASGAVDIEQINTSDFGSNTEQWVLENTNLEVGSGIFSGGDIVPTGTSSALGSPSDLDSMNAWENIYYQSGGLNEESDGRLKENVRAIDGGLDRLQSIRPVSYELKDRDDPETKLGFIAQELEDGIPEVVNEPADSDGYYGVNYTGVIPVTVDAIQELAEEQERLRDRVEELESRLNTREG